ncbi:MAG TPA: hypothetical protein GX707_15450 [Epulopiscium sp.]|nr:hypothetical protein [Candidatus Epulonipiscium sp.]
MNHINLVPLQYKQSFKRRWYIGGGISAGILVIIGLSHLIYLPLHQIKMAEKEQVALDAKLSSEVLADIKNMIEEIALVEKEKSQVEQNLKEMNKPSHASRQTLDIIVANAPGGIRINQITIDGPSNTTNIRGSAQNIASIAQYIGGLHNTQQFQEITYTTSPNSDQDIKWKIEYDIDIRLKPFREDVEESDDSGGEDAL